MGSRLCSRRNVRLKECGFIQPGGYFVTICTPGREPISGEITDGEMMMTRFGEIAPACWLGIRGHFPDVEPDAYAFMPNRKQGRQEGFGKPFSGTLPTVNRPHKSAVTRRVNKVRQSPASSLWQRNSFEHIIRSERTVRPSIQENPLRGYSDHCSPRAADTDHQAQQWWRWLRVERARLDWTAAPLRRGKAAR